LICNSSSSLASLNVKNGNNANFNSFWAYSNPNLLCIEVDDTAWASANWTVANNQIDATASFSEDCIDINCSADFTLYPDTVLDHNWFLIAEVNGAQPISYFWEWGDGATSTGSNPSHTYNVPGYYNICLTITDANNCSSTYCDSSTYVYKTDEIITISVVDQIPNGIEETENSFVKVYPNPASSSITIETGQGKGIYQLQDVSGKIILQGSINAARYTLDISILAKGIYVLSITNGDKQAHKKIVKE